MSEGSHRRAAIQKILQTEPHKIAITSPSHSLEDENQYPSSSLWWERNWAVNVFTDDQLKKRVPKSIYKGFRHSVESHAQLDTVIADVIASAMKDWAVEKGATHFTHWFQPFYTSIAEKHEAFFSINSQGKTLLEFNGTELIRGETDASSFPSGGIRCTSEARGYTSWDPSSYVFLKEGTNGTILVIPSVFCSWTGEALDYKTPLLRSINALSVNATRLLHIIGEDKVERVTTTLGPEQEFFLIDRSFFLGRPDLVLSERTVLGAKPSKGQELEDHYFGRMHPRILAYLQEVEQELWKIGIPTKTRHNEVAPAQHELAPIFEESNLAADHNTITMEIMKEVASKHNLACLLHEKPFQGINGSGKHNNWSMATNTGINLLDPTNPETSHIFKVFLTAVIKAVNIHADLLRCSIANPGNDFRLGAQEAPPAIMSIYLGAELETLVIKLSGLENTKPFSRQASRNVLSVADNLAPIPRDRTDRNRTSPFAFTGNKFEFRAVGSSQNIAHTCMIVNVIVADAVRSISDEIEQKIANKIPKEQAIEEVIKQTLRVHSRVCFGGNGYSEDWVKEALARGLPNYPNTVSALENFASDKNKRLFDSLNVLAPSEVESRKNIMFEHYTNTLNIEALVTQELINSYVLPNAFKYQKEVAASLINLKNVTGGIYPSQTEMLTEISTNIEGLILANKKITDALNGAESTHSNVTTHAKHFRDVVKKSLEVARGYSDKLEKLIADEYWQLPKYYDMLFLK